MNNIKILYCNRIGISLGIDTNKTTTSKDCDIYQYWYFLNEGLSFNHMYAIDVMIY